MDFISGRQRKHFISLDHLQSICEFSGTISSDINKQICRLAFLTCIHEHTRTHNWSSIPGGFFLMKAP